MNFFSFWIYIACNPLLRFLLYRLAVEVHGYSCTEDRYFSSVHAWTNLKTCLRSPAVVNACTPPNCICWTLSCINFFLFVSTLNCFTFFVLCSHHYLLIYLRVYVSILARFADFFPKVIQSNFWIYSLRSIRKSFIDDDAKLMPVFSLVNTTHQLWCFLFLSFFSSKKSFLKCAQIGNKAASKDYSRFNDVPFAVAGCWNREFSSCATIKHFYALTFNQKIVTSYLRVCI